MPRYDVFLEGRAEISTRYFAVSVLADEIALVEDAPTLFYLLENGA